MKFLVLSDIHGDLEHLGKLEGEFKKADAVLFAGDFAKFGEPETAEPVLEKSGKVMLSIGISLNLVTFYQKNVSGSLKQKYKIKRRIINN